MSDYQIHHQSEECLFYVDLEDGQRAFLKYHRSGSESAKAMVDFYSTFVPNAYRGQALASQLVDHAFAWADENTLHINTSCWYAAKKMECRDLKM
ncbi:MAG: putative GNAT family acetyltransferase [Arenicella sp.]|jgi:predicted GNAT family acetyltransferase